MLDIGAAYRFNDAFELSERSGRFIYVNFDTADWVRTNRCGNDIINSCTGEKTLRDIMDSYAARLGIPSGVIMDNCRSFLEKAVNAGLIYSGDTPPEPIKQQFHMSVPETVWVHVSSRCNLRCPFCYSESSPERANTLEIDKILRFLGQIDEQARGSVIISGGEPFLYDGLVELLSGIKQLGFTVQLITNGTVGHEKYKAVSKYIDRLQFSVDGTTAEINDRTRGKGSFARLMKGISEAAKCGFPFTMISFTVSSNNVHQLAELPRFAESRNIDQINISRIVPVGRGESTDISVDDCQYGEQLMGFLEEYKRVVSGGSVLRVSVSDDQSEKLRVQGRRYSCGLADSIISIWYNGKIYPCPSLHDERFAIGEYNDDLDKIIENGHRLNERFSVDSSESGCSECKYRYFCGGGCLAKRVANGSGSYCMGCMRDIDALFEKME